MAANTDPIFKKNRQAYPAQLTDADTTVAAPMGTTGGEGAIIESILCSTDDTSTVDLQFYLNDGAIDHYIGRVPVAAGSGYGSALVEALSILAPDTHELGIPQGWTLKVGCLATMTAAKVTDVVGLGGDY